MRARPLMGGRAAPPPRGGLGRRSRSHHCRPVRALPALPLRGAVVDSLPRLQLTAASMALTKACVSWKEYSGFSKVIRVSNILSDSSGTLLRLGREAAVRAEVADVYRVAVHGGAEAAERAGKGDFPVEGAVLGVH